MNFQCSHLHIKKKKKKKRLLSLAKLIAPKWLFTRCYQAKMLSSFAPSAADKLVRKRRRNQNATILFNSGESSVHLRPRLLHIATCICSLWQRNDSFHSASSRTFERYLHPRRDAPNRSSRVLSAAVNVSQVYRSRLLGTNGCKLREWKGVPTWKHYRVEGSFPPSRTGTPSGFLRAPM